MGRQEMVAFRRILAHANDVLDYHEENLGFGILRWAIKSLGTHQFFGKSKSGYIVMTSQHRNINIATSTVLDPNSYDQYACTRNQFGSI